MSMDNAVEGHRAASSWLARVRSIFAATIGGLVEWYDWYTYPTLALYFSKSFFPQVDQTAQLLNAAGIFALGFMIRPLGSWLMGVYADRKGRKPAMMLSMVVMGCGSLGIAFIPSYATIGVMAPVLLVFFRVVQGLSLGGQYAASATYISEMAIRKRRGFWGSIHYVTILLGLLLSMSVLLVLQAVLTSDELIAWGWRIPFLIGTVMAGVAYFVISSVNETKSFEAVQRLAERPRTWPLMAKHWRELLIVFVVTAAGTTAYQNYAIYMPKFLVNTSGFSAETAAQISTATIVIFMFLQPLLGWISDFVGRKALLVTFSALGTLGTVPIMMALEKADQSTNAFLILTFAFVILSPYTAVSALFKAELFPAEIRALGVGLSFAAAQAVFGGSAEFIALSFKRANHESYYYWFLTALMFVAFLTTLRMRDPQRHSRITED